MRVWLIRGVALGVVFVAARAAVGFASAGSPAHGWIFRLLGALVVVVVAALWAGRDARVGLPDLSIRWVQAGALAALGGGVAAWLLDRVPGFDLGDNTLIFELTSGAAWTLLLVVIPAMAGAGLGRMRAGRRAKVG